MSEKRDFHFKTDDEELIKWLDSQNEKSIFIINFLNKVRKGELVEKSVKEEIKEIKNENEKLRNLKLKLDIWKDLKQEGFTLTKAQEIFSGKSTPLLPSTSELKEKFDNVAIEKSGFDKDGFCDFCHHRHANTEPRVCTDLYCNCGVRG